MSLSNETHPSAADDTSASIGAARPKFCSQCGATWLPDWNACPLCSAQSAPRSIQYSGIGAALSLYFTLLALSIITIIAVGAGAGLVQTEFTFLAVEAIIVVAWCAVGWKLIFPTLTTRFQPAWFVAAAVLALCTFGIAAGFLTFLHRELNVPLLKYAAPILRAGYGWSTVVLTVAVMPAIFEELAFRGVILTSLTRVMGSTEAGVVSAFMFMVLHLSVPSFPHLLLMGLALAYLRLKSGSVLPGMLLHFTHNLLCIVAEHRVGPHFFL
jgi:membrane protease YdiL (CAAX protease family)